MNSSTSSRFLNAFWAFLLVVSLGTCGFTCVGCASNEGEPTEVTQINKTSETKKADQPKKTDDAKKDLKDTKGATSETSPAKSENKAAAKPQAQSQGSAKSQADDEFDAEDIPKYDGDPYVEVEGNDPDFTRAETTDDAFEDYDPLDELGRCTVATACIGLETMPTEDRGSISSVHPTGWHSVKYEWVDGKYLYNRCHLIGFQLTGENANERNLITGTRSMNVDGMLPFENEVAEYVEDTGNHVMYRVTVIYADDDDLVAQGVQMEAESVEDKGRGVCFNVFVYNVEDGVAIDYDTGESKPDGTVSGLKTGTGKVNGNSGSGGKADNHKSHAGNQGKCKYIANANSKKLHYPDCSSVDQMNESNKVYLNCTRQQALNQGYDPCGRCQP